MDTRFVDSGAAKLVIAYESYILLTSMCHDSSNSVARVLPAAIDIKNDRRLDLLLTQSVVY